MNDRTSRPLTAGILLGACVLMSACAPVAPLATGEAARTWIREQTFNPEATAQHGDRASEGTDPELANGAVEQLRKPPSSRRSGPRSMPDVLKDLVE